MRRKTKSKISEAEKRRRLEQRRQVREQARPAAGRMLYERSQAAFKLGGISLSSLRRLEQAGKLKPIRPSGSPSGRVYYAEADLLKLVGGDNA